MSVSSPFFCACSDLLPIRLDIVQSCNQLDFFSPFLGTEAAKFRKIKVLIFNPFLFLKDDGAKVLEVSFYLPA